MTAHSLIIAVTVGIVVGVAGHILTCRGRSVPLWLPPAAAVAAAVLATVIARMANASRPDLTPAEIIVQVLSAVAVVALVAVTGGPAPAGAPREHAGENGSGSAGGRRSRRAG
ncbi:GlsB/YeaQ/YmgE family stress response membrane protein [Actinoplanes sp. NBC_00393]|uniref:GlsB/YeaQ/YmgE family stress response membrane protein n=1 Tax=Actinoplanes sp. NBC_00393 TaxID=2975953 RepID=UPI002E21EA7D